MLYSYKQEITGISLEERWFLFMGLYLNPGNEGFFESVSSQIYVDKTELISVYKPGISN